MLFVLLLLTIVATAPCGGQCAVNTDCSFNAANPCELCRESVCMGNGELGSYCNPNTPNIDYCYSSPDIACDKPSSICKLGCTAPCHNNSQCARTGRGGCPKCGGGRCTQSGCGQTCHNNTECSANTDGCTICVSGRCIQPGCGQACSGNYDCVQNTKDGCLKCIRGQCVPGGCGSVCYYHPDCAGQGNCTQCNGRFDGGFGLCTAFCGGGCLSNAQCNGTLTNCGQCSGGQCGASAQKGVGCVNGNGCTAPNPRCIKFKCAPPAACGEQCSVDLDCDPSNCWACIDSVCKKPSFFN